MSTSTTRQIPGMQQVVPEMNSTETGFMDNSQMHSKKNMKNEIAITADDVFPSVKP